VTFSDRGVSDAHRVTIQWGDGSPDWTTTLAAGVRTTLFVASYLYLAWNLCGAVDRKRRTGTTSLSTSINVVTPRVWYVNCLATGTDNGTS